VFFYPPGLPPVPFDGERFLADPPFFFAINLLPLTRPRRASFPVSPGTQRFKFVPPALPPLLACFSFGERLSPPPLFFFYHESFPCFCAKLFLGEPFSDPAFSNPSGYSLCFCQPILFARSQPFFFFYQGGPFFPRSFSDPPKREVHSPALDLYFVFLFLKPTFNTLSPPVDPPDLFLSYPGKRFFWFLPRSRKRGCRGAGFCVFLVL